MGNIIQQVEGRAAVDVRCTICAQDNSPGRLCKHVRWTFDQGDPLDFARFALETSPYVQARGHHAGEIPEFWWNENGQWVVDMVMIHFDAFEGYVFGEMCDVDLLARDVWKAFHPDAERPQMQRVDPV